MPARRLSGHHRFQHGLLATSLGIGVALACSSTVRSMGDDDGAGGTGGTGGAGGAGGATGGAGTAGMTADGGSAGTNGQGGTQPSSGSGGTPGASGSASTGESGAGGQTSTGGAGGSTSLGGFCANQMVPAGIDSADFQCLDFEDGLPDPAVWAPATTGTASADISTARAFSLPNSLLSSAPAAAAFADETTAKLAWTAVGAQAVDAVSISLELNPSSFTPLLPAWSGAVELLCIEFGFGTACLDYTIGSERAFASDYTGLFVQWLYTGGPAFLDECEVTETFDFALWNDVAFSASADGAVDVSINGVPAVTGCTAAFADDTVATVSIGLGVVNETTSSWSVYFDDVVATVSRLR